MTSLGCLNHVEALSTPLVLFGVGSVALVVLNQIPQYLKIIKARSAESLSAATLGIGNVASSFNVVNLTILHANQIKVCFEGGKASGRGGASASLLNCQSSLLVLYSGLCGFLACFPIYLLKLKYARRLADQCSGAATRGRLLAGLYLQCALILTAAVPALLSIMPNGSCERYRDYANVIGFINTILLCGQFLPQIYSVYKFKGSGQVSYMTLGFDSIGGIMMVLYRIYATEERLSSWLPYMIFHTSEAMVVLVAFYFDSGGRLAHHGRRAFGKTSFKLKTSPNPYKKLKQRNSREPESPGSECSSAYIDQESPLIS